MPTTTVSMPDTVQAGEPFSIGGEFCSDGGDFTTSALIVGGTMVAQSQYSSGFGGCDALSIQAGDFDDRSLSDGFENDDRFESQGDKLVITQPGTYSWEVDDPNAIITGAIEVTQPPQPNLSITGCSTQGSVTVGTPASVSATVSNTGSADGAAAVGVFVDGSQVESMTKNITAGGQATYEFELTFQSPTEAQVSVELL